jgi:hypothetical protein
MVFWCDSSEYRGEGLGSQEVGSWLRLEREEGVMLSSSDFEERYEKLSDEHGQCPYWLQRREDQAMTAMEKLEEITRIRGSRKWTMHVQK